MIGILKLNPPADAAAFTLTSDATFIFVGELKSSKIIVFLNASSGTWIWSTKSLLPGLSAFVKILSAGCEPPWTYPLTALVVLLLSHGPSKVENALLKVSQLSGVEFDWKELSDEDKESVHSNEGHDVGVIAQEVEKVLPEVVTERDTGYKAVKYEKMIPLLIEAIKELKDENKDLRAEIEALKNINS